MMLILKTRAWILILPKNNNSGNCPLTNANLEDKFSVVYFPTAETSWNTCLEDRFSVVYFSTAETTWNCLLKE